MNQASPKRFQDFAEFLPGFVQELNDLAADGAVVLVEGKRDVRALVNLGYSGFVLTMSALRTGGSPLAAGAKKVVILTDLDREGRQLAARCVRLFSANGIEASLAQRRRLAGASKGVFLHVENLSRFAPLQLVPGE